MNRRPLLHVLTILVAIVLSTFAALGCGDDDGDGGSDDPLTLLETAASKPIESAEVRLRSTANIPGFPILGDRLSLTAAGPIAANGSDLPELDWDVTLRAGGQTFPARMTVLDGRAYVDFQGLTYEADRELMDLLPHDRDDSGKDAMSLRRLGIDPSDWLENAKVEEGEDIGGDSTRLVTGTVDERAVLADLAQAAMSPDVQDKLEEAKGAKGLADLGADDLGRVADAVEKVEVEVNVDDEGYARRVSASLGFEVPEGVEDAAFDHGTVSFELVIEKIGARVDAQPPSNPRPLSDLFSFAGVIFGIDELSDLWTVPR